MKILHVIPTYVPAWRYGGPIASVHGLCKSLVKSGNEVHVFTTNVDGPSDSNVPLREPVDIDGVKVWYFPSRFLRRVYWSPLLAKTLEEEIRHFDIVHLHSIFLWPTWAAARIAKRRNIPYIASPRGMLVKSLVQRKNRLFKSLWINFVERHTLENASLVHTTSEIEAKEVASFGFKLPEVVIIPNGVEEEILNSCGQVSPSRFILFLGRISWKKGLDRLIRAFSYLRNGRLLIAGNDEGAYTHSLEKLAKTLGVQDRITFVGPVYGEEKIALLKSATLFVLPSYSENFGNAVLEAMAAGCPVVITPEVGLAPTVEESGAGLVVDGNPEILGKRIENLLNQPELLKRMSEAGRKVVRECFTWDLIAQKMDSVYREILIHNARENYAGSFNLQRSA